MMSTEPMITDLTEIVGDLSVPCDFVQTWKDFHHTAAQWVAHRISCGCGNSGGARLICTGCKDTLMLSEDALQCAGPGCDVIYQPARTIISSIEPL